jgi:hypothetical protein
MTDVEREGFNKMLASMNIGVVPSGDMSGRADAPAPLVRIQPAPAGGPQKPSDRGTGQDMHIDVVPPRVGVPKHEDQPAMVLTVPARAQLNPVEQRALDRFVDRQRRNGNMTPQLMDALRKSSADQLRKRLKTAIAEQPKIDAQREAAQRVNQANAPDPRGARFDHEHDEGGGVTSRWTGAADQRPSSREVEEAKHVSGATGEPVVLYGNNFAGVDGTIGNPPRLFQLKSAPDAPTLSRVIMDAKQNAQRHGDRGLELHVVARGLTMDQVNGELQRNPVTFGAWLSRVVVHVQGGFIPVTSSGHPGPGGGGGADRSAPPAKPPAKPPVKPPADPRPRQRFEDTIESGKDQPKKSPKPPADVKAKKDPEPGRQTVNDPSRRKDSDEPVADKTKTPARDDPTPDKTAPKPTDAKPATPPAPPAPTPSQKLAQRLDRLRVVRRERVDELTVLLKDEAAAREKADAKRKQVIAAKDKAKQDRLRREWEALDEDLADVEAARMTKQQHIEAIDLAITKAAHPLPREAGDVAVAGRQARTPRDLAGRRIGGTPNQEAQMRADVERLVKQGATDIRIDEFQVDVDRNQQGVNRPDVQYVLNGRRYYIEYEQPNNPRGRAHAQRTIANDPRGTVYVKLVPTNAGFIPNTGVKVLTYTLDEIATNAP